MRIVFGMVDDKDLNTVMGLLPKDAVYYFTKANNKRAIDEHEIMRLGESLHLNATCYKNVKSAYLKAVEESGDDDFIFIGGQQLHCCRLSEHLYLIVFNNKLKYFHTFHLCFSTFLIYFANKFSTTT